jgi:hypothetical protein
VRVDDHSSDLAESVAANHVGGLSSHSREPQEIFFRLGKLSAEFLLQDGAGAPKAPGLVVEEAGRTDVALELARRRLRVVGRAPIFPEELFRHRIDPFIRALRRKHRRDEELEGALKIEPASGLRIFAFEPPDDRSRAGFLSESDSRDIAGFYSDPGLFFRRRMRS